MLGKYEKKVIVKAYLFVEALKQIINPEAKTSGEIMDLFDRGIEVKEERDFNDCLDALIINREHLYDGIYDDVYDEPGYYKGKEVERIV